MTVEHPSASRVPTRLGMLLFNAKAWIFRARRLLHDWLGERPKKLQQARISNSATAWAESTSPLFSSQRPEEFALEAGKVQNLRLAAQHLHGIVIRKGGVFSFWAHVPRPTRSGGFALGRELREGCIVPSIGGGLCQLSNALFDAALTAGCEIIERHAHSHRVPGSRTMIGRDATIFWNYVDLRFRPAADCQLSVEIDARELRVRLLALDSTAAPVPAGPVMAEFDLRPPVESCETCGVTDCFRHPRGLSLRRNAATGSLTDAQSRECKERGGLTARRRDWLSLPRDGWGRVANYAWIPPAGVGIPKAPAVIDLRSSALPRMAAQGVAAWFERQPSRLLAAITRMISVAASILALVLSAAIFSAAQAQDLGGDLTLHRLLVDGESWQLVAENLGFADGPCTDLEGNFYFSDMKADAIFKITPEGQRTQIAGEPASGLKFGPDGRLYACQGSKKRLITIDLASGQIDVVAENVQPNDLVVTHRGHVYFTDTGRKQIVFVDAKTKEIRAGDTDIEGPNGITLSPDQGTLAVSDYRGAHVWTFRIEPDGALSAKAPYMTMRLPIDPEGEFKRHEPPPYKKTSGGDGMTSDNVGRYYVATTLGVQVFDPTGRLCGVLPKPQLDKPLTSCGLSGANREYLYVTNGDRIYRRKVQAIGNVFSQPPAAPDAK